MGVPGFAAEASLYLTSARYRSIGAASPNALTGAARPISLATLAAGPMMLPCGSPNWMCCSPPGWVTNPNNIVSCDAGWGCDVASGGWCTQPCGDPGQPCCDGPDTLAPRWIVVNGQVRVYSPEGLGPDGLPLKEMCRSGVCDRATHRCIACGTQAQQPCCPPDPNYGVARCRDLHLDCQLDAGDPTRGTCASCGIEGSPPCYWGCDPKLGVRIGLCAKCCGDGQPPCDTGCCGGLRVAGGLCRQCGKANQIPCDSGCDQGNVNKGGVCTPCGGANQIPCDSGCDQGFVNKGGVCTPCGGRGQSPCPKQYPADTGCQGGLGVRGGICGYCGRASQYPCDNGCGRGSGLGIQNGRCAYCGASGQSPCDGGKCKDGLGISGGRCLACGGFTLPPCDNGCDLGLVLQNGQCVSSTPCANFGEACVPDNQPGTHCCQGTSNLAKCVYQKCLGCALHGQPCPTGVCCDPNDDCKPDPNTGGTICDIPEGGG